MMTVDKIDFILRSFVIMKKNPNFLIALSLFIFLGCGAEDLSELGPFGVEIGKPLDSSIVKKKTERIFSEKVKKRVTFKPRPANDMFKKYSLSITAMSEIVRGVWVKSEESGERKCQTKKYGESTFSGSSNIESESFKLRKQREDLKKSLVQKYGNPVYDGLYKPGKFGCEMDLISTSCDSGLVTDWITDDLWIRLLCFIPHKSKEATLELTYDHLDYISHFSASDPEGAAKRYGLPLKAGKNYELMEKEGEELFALRKKEKEEESTGDSSGL